MNFDIPYPICRAVTEVMSSGNFSYLKPRHQQLLCVLLRFVSTKTPGAPIYGWRSYVSSFTGASVDTLERSLDELSKLGLITRFKQDRMRFNGRFSGRPIALTDKAIEVLGLNKSAFARTAKMRDRHIRNPYQGLNKRQPPAAGSLVASEALPPRATEQVTTQVGNHRIPTDLVWLLEGQSGISIPALFKLMSHASQRKTRLSDVASNLKERILKLSLKPSQVFSYIRKCIGMDVDWSYKEKEAKKISEEQSEKAATTKLLSSFADKIVICGDEKFSRVIKFENGAFYGYPTEQSNRSILVHSQLLFLAKQKKIVERGTKEDIHEASHYPKVDRKAEIQNLKLIMQRVL